MTGWSAGADAPDPPSVIIENLLRFARPGACADMQPVDLVSGGRPCRQPTEAPTGQDGRGATRGARARWGPEPASAGVHGLAPERPGRHASGRPPARQRGADGLGRGGPDQQYRRRHSSRGHREDLHTTRPVGQGTAFGLSIYSTYPVNSTGRCRWGWVIVATPASNRGRVLPAGSSHVTKKFARRRIDCASRFSRIARASLNC